MAGGILKTAISASLAVHVAGFAVIAYFQRPLPPMASPVDAPFSLTITALPDESVDADTISLSPPPAQPVEPAPVVPPKPEIIPTPPPEPERIPDPPKPVAVVLQPEPPIMLMPDLLKSPTPAPVTPPAQTFVSGPAVSSETTAAPVTKAGSAARGDRVITRVQPDYRKNSERIYPTESIRRHEEGLVIVTAEVDARGFPRNVELKQTSGHPLLDDAALRAVRSWEFEPARMDGRPVVSTVEVPVNFKLSN